MNTDRGARGPAMLAAGFALLFVSMTLNFPTVAVELAPDFLGWLLLVLAARRLPEAFGLSPRTIKLCSAMVAPMLLVQTILFFRLNGEISWPVTATRMISLVLACAVGWTLCCSVRRAEETQSKNFGGAPLLGAWYAVAAFSLAACFPLARRRGMGCRGGAVLRRLRVRRQRGRLLSAPRVSLRAGAKGMIPPMRPARSV